MLNNPSENPKISSFVCISRANKLIKSAHTFESITLAKVSYLFHCQIYQNFENINIQLFQGTLDLIYGKINIWNVRNINIQFFCRQPWHPDMWQLSRAVQWPRWHAWAQEKLLQDEIHLQVVMMILMITMTKMSTTIMIIMTIFNDLVDTLEHKVNNCKMRLICRWWW